MRYRDLIIMNEVANTAVKFVPDPDDGDRWFVVAGDERIGTVHRHRDYGGRSWSGIPAGYEAKLRYNGRIFRVGRARMVDLKKEVRAFIAQAASNTSINDVPRDGGL